MVIFYKFIKNNYLYDSFSILWSDHLNEITNKKCIIRHKIR